MHASNELLSDVRHKTFEFIVTLGTIEIDRGDIFVEHVLVLVELFGLTFRWSPIAHQARWSIADTSGQSRRCEAM